MSFCLDIIRWIKDQQKSEGVTPGEDVYIILRLDGRVRRSGKVIMTHPSCLIISVTDRSSSLVCLPINLDNDILAISYRYLGLQREPRFRHVETTIRFTSKVDGNVKSL